MNAMRVGKDNGCAWNVGDGLGKDMLALLSMPSMNETEKYY